MSSKMKTGIILFLLCVLIAVLPLVMIKDSEFGGSDDSASGVIDEILQEDYKPWANPLFEPPGGETESLLFCLQAALGAGIFGFGIGTLRERSRQNKAK